MATELTPAERAALEQMTAAFPGSVVHDTAPGRGPHRWIREEHPAFDALVTATALMDGDGLAHELRIIGEVNGERITESGRFDTPGMLAHWAERCDGKANVYLSINPTRFGATHVLKRGKATTDKLIARIRWLPVDWDSIKEPVELIEYLTSLGFPEPFLAHSGHGWWALFRVDQANTPESTELRRRVLAALKEKFPPVDSTVYNPSRVMRLFGTLNVKDPSVPVRSRVVSMPAGLVVMTDELLERVAGDQPERPEPSPEQGTPAQLEPILEKLAAMSITVTSKKRAAKPGDVYQLSACPFYPSKDHHRAAALYAWDDGNVHFQCLGERCQTENHRILDLLDLLGLRAVRASGNWKVLRAIDVTPRPARFAWGGRLVIGDLNAVAAREKAGKGLLLVRLAAELSTGRLTGTPETVLYVSAEEQLDTVQRPRLEAAGADLERVLLAPMGSVGLPDAIPNLVGILEEYDSRWWILDPVNKQFSRNLDPDSKRDVAMVLGELAIASGEHQATVIGSIHLGRAKDGVSPADAWAHSMEFRRATRSGLLLGRVEADGEDDRTICHDFTNYGKPAGAIKATIVTAANGVGTMVLRAEDPFIEPGDLFWRPKPADGSVRAECEAAIQVIHARAGGRRTMPSGAFESVRAAYGNTTIQRARQRLGITVRRESTGPSTMANIWDFGMGAP